MAIREDIVASATQFLQDPSVASSSIESRMSFLRTKNLTQEEIDAALSRVGVQAAPGPMPIAQQQQQQQQPQQYYQPAYPPQYQAWQPPPPPPKRDWRDWFIMATVVGGFSYGAYTLAKRYVVPLIAPPTPEKLEQDKKSIEEQFDKAFGLVEQLAKDTEELKATEQKRTEKLDTALEDIEKIMTELRNANQRRELETQRVKDDVQILKDSIPKAMNTQKDLTDSRLKEVNTELTSLKTLITQRMTAASSSTPANGLRTGATATPAPPASSTEAAASTETPKPASTPTFNRPSPFSGATGAKASIPAWQMAMANKDSAATPAATNGTTSDSNSQQQASASS